MPTSILPRKSLDENGRARVWLLDEKRWHTCWPVDAREMIDLGQAELDEPVTKAAPPPPRTPAPAPATPPGPK